jgi:hypothetical protein
MDRRKLFRWLRKWQRLQRLSADAARRCATLAGKLQLTGDECRVLTDCVVDGAKMVCDSRDIAKHVTLAGAEEARKKAAERTAEWRARHKEKAKRVREAQLADEKAKRLLARQARLLKEIADLE